MSQTVQPRVVFSALYNESEEFLATYVENFLRHTDAGAALVVNLSPGRSIACPIAEASDRVLVFAGALPRRKFGHTLLNGHLEAFEAALGRYGAFDHFCPLASNSLFARRFDLPAARAALERSAHVVSVDLDNLPDEWWWPALSRSPALLPAMKATWGLAKAASNQIEGLFAAASDWGLLHARRAQIVTLGETMLPEGDFPMEEILPATLMCTFGSGRYVNLCHMFWDRFWNQPLSDNIRLDDVLGIGERFPDHVCLLKWFERSPTNLITIAAATGLPADLTARLAAVPEADRGQQRVLHRLMFEEMARVLRSRESFSSLISTWRPAEGGPDLARHLAFDRTLDVNRQFIPLELGPEAQPGQNLAYLFAEQTGARLHLRFEVTDAEQTVVALSSSLADPGSDVGSEADAGAAAGTSDGTALQGFLYLACCLGPGHRIFRLRILSEPGHPASGLEDRIVLVRGGRYVQQAPTPTIEHGGVREFYYPSEAMPDGDDVWIGLPFFGSCDYRVAIDVV